MAWRPHPKGASVSRNSPRAWATDDRTGFIVNHNKLRTQFEWSGDTLINKRILTRAKSLDKPQPQFRTLHIPPDPRPIMNARVEQYWIDESEGATILLSGATIAATAAIGTVIGVLSVNGGYGSYTFSLSSNPGGYFGISGTSLTVASALPLVSTTTYPITVLATGAVNISQPFAITATYTVPSSYEPTYYFLGF